MLSKELGFCVLKHGKKCSVYNHNFVFDIDNHQSIGHGTDDYLCSIGWIKIEKIVSPDRISNEYCHTGDSYFGKIRCFYEVNWKYMFTNYSN